MESFLNLSPHKKSIRLFIALPMAQRIPLFLLILFLGITTVFGQAVTIPPDSTETDYEDVADFLFDTE